MHERKIEMATRVNGFIGLPGGFGTFEEVIDLIAILNKLTRKYLSDLINERFWKWPPGPNSEYTINVRTLLPFCGPAYNPVSPLTAVALLNVLSFWEPLRALIKGSINAGFIKPQHEQLIIFVDGPEDPKEHENFDWGKAALEALDNWERETISPLFKWSKGPYGGTWKMSCDVCCAHVRIGPVI